MSGAVHGAVTLAASGSHQLLVGRLHGEVLDKVYRGGSAGERERAERDAAALAPLPGGAE